MEDESHNFTTTCSPISQNVLIKLLLITLLLFSATTTAATSSSSTQTYKKYIVKACRSTSYPSNCYTSLSPYASKIKANQKKLCNTALFVALKAAKNTSSIVSKLSKKKGLTRSEGRVIKDCISNIKDSIYELQQSVEAMNNLEGSSDVEFQMASIKTWVSAALTDENTCTDGFDGQKLSSLVKNKIRSSVKNVARLTSIALSFINGLKF